MQLKKQFPDAILFFRLGDFYETFDDDAKIVSSELDIVLTSREMGRGQRVPLAGVPCHSVDAHLAKLVSRGYKVAICEQIGDPAASRGLVEREVVRVVTPGTVVEPNMLDSRSNNYLVAVVSSPRAAGIAYVDITTGEFCATELTGDDLADRVRQEMERLQPAEVIVPKEDERNKDTLSDVYRLLRSSYRCSGIDARRLDIERCRQELQTHFGVGSLEGFGCAGFPQAIRAAGAILAYLADTQKPALAQIESLRTYQTASFMVLDPATRRNLELMQTSRSGETKGTLLWVLDRTSTPMGARLLRKWLGQPLLDLKRLNSRQEAVEAFVDDGVMRARVVATLQKLGDLERLVNRVSQGVATPRDLLGLRVGLEAIPQLRRALGADDSQSHNLLPLCERDVVGVQPSTEVPHPNPLPEGEGKDEPVFPLREGKDEPVFPLREGKDERVLRSGEGRDERVLRLGEGRDETVLPSGERATARGVVGATHASPLRALAGLPARLDSCEEIVALIAQSIVEEPPNSLADGGVVASGFSDELDGLRGTTKDARQWVARLEASERERTGIKSLKVGYNRVFGYYLEVSNPNLDQSLADALRRQPSLVTEAQARCSCRTVREHLERCLGYIRKQTLVGAERFITPDLKEQEALILGAQERIVELETRIFKQVCEQVSAARRRILATAEAVAHVDVFVALAEVAVRNKYVRPELDDGDEICIVEGRHPVVELTLRDERFVPNDVHLSNRDAQLVVLTGPNMAGKSTYLLMVGLITLMAQVGSFVPAQYAKIGLVDRIFTRVGAQHDISAGQSTFMVEMAETANILRHASPRSLIILDEIGRGTSTYDGISIARAVAEYVHNHPGLGCKTLFATHYHELTELEEFLPRVRNFRVDVLEEGNQVVFLRRVVPGGADRSYGIHVAKLAGVPRAVTRRAEEVLRGLERDGSKMGAGSCKSSRPTGDTFQLSLFAEPDPVLEDLKSLDVLSMTPLEAISKLFELQNKAKQRDMGQP